MLSSLFRLILFTDLKSILVIMMASELLKKPHVLGGVSLTRRVYQNNQIDKYAAIGSVKNIADNLIRVKGSEMFYSPIVCWDMFFWLPKNGSAM